MNLEINQFVLHQFIKHDDQTLSVMLREAPLEKNHAVNEMMVALNRTYMNKNKGFAKFSEQSRFADALQQYRSNSQDFLTFTRHVALQLRDELAKYTFAEEGIAVFCHYRFLATEYLFVSVLSSCSSMRVNEQLDISATHYLDVANADIVARIDLTEWEQNVESQRYLTFLKGRVGRKVADFFMDFLGADEGLDVKAQNRGLLQAVDDYCEQGQLDRQQKQVCRQQVYDYCNEQLKSGKEIALKGISEELITLNEQDFQQFSIEQGYQLEHQFPADKNLLKTLTKFSGSGGGVSVNFDAVLLDERIFWDPVTDTLTIKGTPPNLRDQLLRSAEKNRKT